MKGIKIEVEHEKPIFLYRPFDVIDAIAYAIYYTANPDTEMCIPNCAYEKADRMFKEWRDEVREKKRKEEKRREKKTKEKFLKED